MHKPHEQLRAQQSWQGYVEHSSSGSEIRVSRQSFQLRPRFGECQERCIRGSELTQRGNEIVEVIAQGIEMHPLDAVVGFEGVEELSSSMVAL